MRLVELGLLQLPVHELDTTAPQFIEPVLSRTSASSTRFDACTTSATTFMLIVSNALPPAIPAKERKIVLIDASATTWKPLSVLVTV
jgi:hypothetical protein